MVTEIFKMLVKTSDFSIISQRLLLNFPTFLRFPDKYILPINIF